MKELPAEMTEIQISGFGGPEVLKPRRVAVPVPQSGEVLVRVFAAGVNRPDILQRLGKYPLPRDAQSTPGLEVAGEVVVVADNVAGIRVGDRVCGLTNGGGYAQFCRIPARQALPWPTGFSAIQAAAVPETFFTVWANLFQTGKARRGETVLVHGGAGGIGTTAILLARAFDLRVFTTAGTDAKCAALLKLGADVAINYRQREFGDVVKAETRGRGVDIILDIVGAAYLQRNMASLAKDGRLIVLGFLGGSIAERFDMGQVMAKRLVITGSAMRPRSQEEKAAIADDLRANVWPLLGPERLQPVIDRTFPLDRTADAHRLMESSGHVGKIVLQVEQ